MILKFVILKLVKKLKIIILSRYYFKFTSITILIIILVTLKLNLKFEDHSFQVFQSRNFFFVCVLKDPRLYNLHDLRLICLQ